jgi:hypothetical protein
MQPQVYYRVHKSPPLVPILHMMNSVHTLTSYLFRIHFNIVTCMSDYRRDLDWRLYLLNTSRSSKYKAIGNLHNVQITTVHAKSFQSAFTSRFPETDFNNGDSSASMLTSSLSGEYPTTELNSLARTAQKIRAPTVPPLLRVDLLPREHVCLRTRYLISAVYIC